MADRSYWLLQRAFTSSTRICSTPAKSIQCGTYYLQWCYEQVGSDESKALDKYAGVSAKNLDMGGPLGRAVVISVSAIVEVERNLIIEQVRMGCGAPRRAAHRPSSDVDRIAILQERSLSRCLSQIAKVHSTPRAFVSRIVKHDGHKGLSPTPSQLAESESPRTETLGGHKGVGW